MCQSRPLSRKPRVRVNASDRPVVSRSTAGPHPVLCAAAISTESRELYPGESRSKGTAVSDEHSTQPPPAAEIEELRRLVARLQEAERERREHYRSLVEASPN